MYSHYEYSQTLRR